MVLQPSTALVAFHIFTTALNPSCTLRDFDTTAPTKLEMKRASSVHHCPSSTSAEAHPFKLQSGSAASKIFRMNQPQHPESGKIMVSLVVLLASSVIVLYQAGSTTLPLFGIRVGGINDSLVSSKGHLRDRTGGRSRGLASTIFEKWGVGLRMRTSGCGLWHPSVEERKTWYVNLKLRLLS